MFKQKIIVVATMVLHNFIRKHGGEDLDRARVDRNPNYVPTILERYQKYVVASNGSTTSPSAPTMDIFRDELATTLSLAWR
jgi:hypothetical protein